MAVVSGLRGQDASAPDAEVNGVDDVDDADWGQAALWSGGRRWRGPIWLLGVFCAYVGAALLYPFTETGGVSLFWMPNAVLITAMLRFRPRDWPYIYAVGLLAEVVADLTYGVVPYKALYFGLVNNIEATLVLLFAALIAGGRRNIGLLSLRGVAALALAAVTVPALTAGLGAIGSVWTFNSDYFTGWRTWWFGDSLGILVGLAVGLLLRDAGRSVARRRSTRISVRSGAAAALMMALAAFLAVNEHFWGTQQTALAGGVLLSLAFGAVGAPIAAVSIATVTLIGMAQGEGFTSAPQEQALLFVSFTALYAIAAMTETSDRHEQKLSRQRDDLVKAQRELERLAHFDSLTGLANRAEAFARLEAAMRSSRHPGPELGVLFCDIDRFKSVNDTWGHAAGDLVLSTLANRIRDCLRQGDTVGRIGGDELLVLLPGLHNLDEVAKIAEMVRERAAEPICESGITVQATLSIGATLAIPGESVGEMTARVDEAMYRAKQEGRNRVICAESTKPCKPAAP